jgi:hypothetical protein
MNKLVYYSRRNVKGKRCGVLLKGLSHEKDFAFDAKSIFLAVNANLRWLNNVSCLLLSFLQITIGV